jgi:hypothetical protein
VAPGGHLRNVPDPVGMSGGPVFRLDWTGSGAHKLVGILTNRPFRKAILATHIAVVLEAIKSLAPDDRDKIPTGRFCAIQSRVKDM